MTNELKEAITSLRKYIEVDKMSLQDAYDKTVAQHTLGLNEAAELWDMAKEKYGVEKL